jgi:hypothetical protein
LYLLTPGVRAVTDSAKKNVTIGGIVGGAVIISALIALGGFETKVSHASDLAAVKASQAYQYNRLLCEVRALRKNDRDAVCE